jgi:hypothetical protein
MRLNQTPQASLLGCKYWLLHHPRIACLDAVYNTNIPGEEQNEAIDPTKSRCLSPPSWLQRKWCRASLVVKMTLVRLTSSIVRSGAGTSSSSGMGSVKSPTHPMLALAITVWRVWDGDNQIAVLKNCYYEVHEVMSQWMKW